LIRMLCMARQKLNDEFTEAVRQMSMSDADMKNPKITLRIRNERWKISATRVSEARDRLHKHQSECPVCNETA